MSDAEITAMIERLIAREGGYVDHPNDVGGCTNMGITRETLEQHRGKPTTCADVRALHKAEAVAIYRKSWFSHKRLRLGQWPYRKLAEVTLDAAIMFALGREMSVKWVQAGINALRPAVEPLKVDGWAGPSTLAAMVMCDQHKLVAYVVAERCRKHARVVKTSPSQAAFIEGWINRATAWVMVPNGAPEVAKPAPNPAENRDSPALKPDASHDTLARLARESEPAPEIPDFGGLVLARTAQPGEMYPGVKVYFAGSVGLQKAGLGVNITPIRRLATRLTREEVDYLHELDPRGAALGFGSEPA